MQRRFGGTYGWRRDNDRIGRRKWGLCYAPGGRRRRLTQLDLALQADVSTRHLSYVENGRARPTSSMILHLSDQLEIPLARAQRACCSPADTHPLSPSTS